MLPIPFAVGDAIQPGLADMGRWSATGGRDHPSVNHCRARFFARGLSNGGGFLEHSDFVGDGRRDSIESEIGRAASTIAITRARTIFHAKTKSTTG